MSMKQGMKGPAPDQRGRMPAATDCPEGRGSDRQERPEELGRRFRTLAPLGSAGCVTEMVRAAAHWVGGWHEIPQSGSSSLLRCLRESPIASTGNVSADVTPGHVCGSRRRGEESSTRRGLVVPYTVSRLTWRRVATNRPWPAPFGPSGRNWPGVAPAPDRHGRQEYSMAHDQQSDGAGEEHLGRVGRASADGIELDGGRYTSWRPPPTLALSFTDWSEFRVSSQPNTA